MLKLFTIIAIPFVTPFWLLKKLIKIWSVSKSKVVIYVLDTSTEVVKKNSLFESEKVGKVSD